MLLPTNGVPEMIGSVLLIGTAPAGKKLALTLCAEFIATVQVGALPLQAPPQLANL